MAASLKAAKSALRKEMKRKIASLSDVEKSRQSKIVIKKLFNSSFYKQSERVSVFLSMHDEIHTSEIVKDLLTREGRKCYIPRYIGDGMEMVRLHSWQDYETLPETKWKIKQPADDDVRENALETGGLDLVLMPGLAFTPSGDRLGRGKGYYDKYLTRLTEVQSRRPATIALAFKEQICETLPTDERDVPLNWVLFEDSEV